MANELDQDLLDDIEQAVADGARTDQEIADGIGWNVSTFCDWKNGQLRKGGAEKSAKIRHAIKKGKGRQRKIFLKNAEYSLMKRVTGYSYDETTVEKIDDEKNGVTTTKEKTVVKKSEPNMTAIIFALVNNSSRWRSVNREQVTVAIQGKIESIDAPLTDKQTEQWRKQYPQDYDEFDIGEQEPN